MSPALTREVKDIDLITSSRERFTVAEMLAASGYQLDKEFNAFQGGRRRLLFYCPRDRQLDVFVGDFSMRRRHPARPAPHARPGPTLPLAELGQRKLQIVKETRATAPISTGCSWRMAWATGTGAPHQRSAHRRAVQQGLGSGANGDDRP